jgi:PKD repeat protein
MKMKLFRQLHKFQKIFLSSLLLIFSIFSTTIYGQSCDPTTVIVSNVTATDATITWTAVEGAKQYAIAYVSDIFGTTGIYTVPNPSPSVLPLTINLSQLGFTGIRSDGSYQTYLRVTCVNGKSNDTRFYFTNAPQTCAVPKGVAIAGLSATTVTLTWKAVTEASGYILQYKTTSAQIWKSAPMVTGTTTTISGLTEGVLYDIQVITVCGTDQSNHARAITVSPCKEGFATANFSNTNAQKSANRVFFSNNSLNVKTFSWDFGDGTTDAIQVNPVHVFPRLGEYSVCLKTSNSCNNNSVCQTVSLTGLTAITPSVSALQSVFPMDIQGFGFVQNSRVQLYQGSNIINAGPVIFVDNTLLKAKFDLSDNAAHIGDWSVRVISPDGNQTLSLANGFKIEQPTSKALEVNLIGPNEILGFRDFNYQVAITNSSNQTAYGVPVSIRISKDVTAGITSLIADKDIDPTVTFPEGRFYKAKTPNSKKTAQFAQLIIPKILPLTTKYVNFFVSYKSIDETDFQIAVTGGGALANGELLKRAGFLRGVQCDSPNDPCEVDVFQLIMDRYTSLINGNAVACLSFSEQLNCTLAAYTTQDGEPLIDMNAIAKSMAKCAANVTPNKFDDYFSDYLGAVDDVSAYIDLFDNCTSFQNINANGQKEKAKKDTKDKVLVVSSKDPNLKVGKKGINNANYVGNNTLLSFTIYFENADSATAPASEVVVLDTLDKTKLDIKTLQFSEFNFGDTTFKVQTKAQKFTNDFDLRPKKNTILRVSGDLDTLTGVLKWRFISFDPKNMALTQDIRQGFLPPNKIKPQGEGHVGYIIRTKDNLPDLTAIKNSAFIVFDGNPAIATPIWTNTIDLTPPTSKAISAFRVNQDTNVLITVKWQGADAHSGIQDYKVFVTENRGAWKLWLPSERGDSAIFKGKRSNNYCFYTIATDNANNVEIKQAPSTTICTLLNPTKEVQGGRIAFVGQNTPNPFNGTTSITYNLLASVKQIALTVFDLDGKIVKALKNLPNNEGEHLIDLQVQDLPNGLYFYRLTADGWANTHKMILNHF